MLAALAIEENTRMWRNILASPDAIVLVAERVDTVNAAEADGGKSAEPVIVGFGSAGAARDAALGVTGEVSAIYLLDAVKRRGLGRALFTGLMRALVAG